MFIILFVEYVCPSLGYVEFLHIDWLKQILSWQQPNGCYAEAQGSVKHGRQHHNSQDRSPRAVGNDGVVIQHLKGLIYNGGGINNKTQLDIINTKHEDAEGGDNHDEDSQQKQDDFILGDNPGPLEIFQGVPDDPDQLAGRDMGDGDDYHYIKNQAVDDRKASANRDLNYFKLPQPVGPMGQNDELLSDDLKSQRSAMRKLLLEKEMGGRLFRLTV